MSDWSELRAKAEEATPGPWTVARWHGGTVITERWAQEEDAPSDRGPFTSIGAANDYDAAFIAAANPTAVLALLDRLEAAEAAVERVRALADELDDIDPHPWTTLDGVCVGGAIRYALEGDS